MSQTIHYISNESLDIETIDKIIGGKYGLSLSGKSIEQVVKCRAYLENKIEDTDTLFYGINTGFGSLCNIRISKEEVELLQNKLILSHACGVGEPVPEDIVRIILLLKIQSLSYGFSGVRLELINQLLLLYNNNVLPVVYEQGSLGASGDLAPLAHIALPLAGMGEVWYNGKRQVTQELFKIKGWKGIQLEEKEGIALLNGTQFSAAYGVYTLVKAQKLFRWANIIAALSIDAFNCKKEPYDERLHQIRPHQGQILVAQYINEFLADSEIQKKEKIHVQDPYAFRCIPQVHGASYAAIEHIKQIFHTEINAVTDNPNIFVASDAILSGGNFHAQPLALPLDYLAIALAELGNISERRVFQLISGQRGLPTYLVPNAGLDSGYMIAQYTAASIVSQNKQLCTPASVDSIVSCNGQEDHVSMAANAATKCFRVVQNVERLLAIEFMIAAQGMEFRRPLKTAPFLEKIIQKYREKVPVLEVDRWLSPDIEKTITFMQNHLF